MLRAGPPNPGLRAGSIVGSDVADNALTGAQIDESTLNGVNAAQLGGQPAAAFQRSCQNGALKARATIDVSAVSTTDFTEDGVMSRFSCSGEPVLVSRSGTGRYFVVLDDGGSDEDFIGVSNTFAIGAPYLSANGQVGGSITFQCASAPPPFVHCNDIRLANSAGAAADFDFVVLIF